MRRSILLLPLLLIVAACATASSGGSGRSTNELLREEILQLQVVTAYQAVERARPQWLNSRASPTPTSPDGAEPVVYIDGIRAGDLGELVQIRADVVVRMEYMRPSDATSRYGTNHQGGAILVTTR